MTSIIGLRELASDEVLYTVDVNQWVGAIITDLGKTPLLSDTAKFAPRIQTYALSQRRMLNGKKLVIGSSRRILSTLSFTLENSKDPDGFCREDPKLRVPAKVTEAWFLRRYNALARVGAIFFDQTVWGKPELELLAAAPYGAPDWEDQGVLQTAMTLDSEAIIGLDDPFMRAVELRRQRQISNIYWIGPPEMRDLLPG